MKTCLIVDDSSVVRKIARKIIEDQIGFQCEEAEDGLKALEACEKSMPTCILLDWNMPNMNGIEFLRALKEKQIENFPVVVFCTTETDISYIQEAIEAGADEYIMKPYDHDILIDKFKQVNLIDDN